MLTIRLYRFQTKTQRSPNRELLKKVLFHPAMKGRVKKRFLLKVKALRARPHPAKKAAHCRKNLLKSPCRVMRKEHPKHLRITLVMHRQILRLKKKLLKSHMV